jgi:hypothetical protein
MRGDKMVVYSAAVAVGALVNVGIGIRTYTKTPQSTIAKKFLFITGFFLLWGLAEAVAPFLSDPLFLVRLSYVPLFLIPYSLCFLASHVSEGRWKIPLYVSKFYLVFAVLLFGNLVIQDTLPTEYGYGLVTGMLFPHMTIVYTSMTVVGVFLVYAERVNLKDVGKIHRVDAIVYGIIISVIFIYLFKLFSPLIGWELPKIGYLFTVFSTATFSYAYMKGNASVFPKIERTVTVQDALCGARCSMCSAYSARECPSCVAADESIKKECNIYGCAQEKDTNCHQCKDIFTCSIYAEYKEKCPFSHLLNWFSSGSSYRIDSPTYIEGRTLFRDRLVCGDFGLIVSREHPVNFFGEWDLEQVPLLWLSVLEENTWTVNPTNLGKLSHTIINFIKEYPISCILFEGFEYLVVHNSFDTIMKFVYSLDDTIIQDKCRFILSYDSRTLDEEKAALLEKELKPVFSEYDKKV